MLRDIPIPTHEQSNFSIYIIHHLIQEHSEVIK